ncbi:disulfide bond formation protein B [Massilia sp. TS11]|uniref:disulfide bond formation protein B n=1 Tax=Massilia sp. TS11 TaxID=2908003 RepID=UPI001EDB4C24|nr:disulfide bond formation protein B [Massilia sp. TS11]MCG2585757.1 disulfide bond formation protein B [Massilia sp. TS11]
MLDQRKLLAAIGLVCFGFVAFAVYLQLALDMLPCPLCIIQRYAFLGAGIACLLAAAFKTPRAGLLVAGLCIAGGIVTVAKHLWVLAHPGVSCGIDPTETFLNRLPTASLLPDVFLANGICELATERLLGLNVPTWAAIAFALVSLALLLTWRRGRR